MNKTITEEQKIKYAIKQKIKWNLIKINNPELYQKKLDNVKKWRNNNRYEAQYGKYRVRAKIKKIDYTLTLEQFKELVNQPCHYCGKEITTSKFNGIDRKDNTKGYTLTNCLPCCKDCNFAKNTRTYDEYIKWILQSARHLAHIPTISPIVN